MNEFMVCLDVEVEEADLGLFGSILSRVAKRKPKAGKVYFRSEDRNSYLKGGEVTALERIVSKRIGSGTNLIAIDGLFATGINVALIASEVELKEFQSRDGFEILYLASLKE